MKILRIVGFAAVIALIVAAIGAAVEIGDLRARLDALDPDRFEAELEQALARLESQQTEAQARTATDTSLTLEQLSEGADHPGAWHDYLHRAWCSYTHPLREPARPYLNDTGLPMELAATIGQPGSCDLIVFVDREQVLRKTTTQDPSSYAFCSATVTVPPGSSYSIELDSPTSNMSFQSWAELRPQGNCFGTSPSQAAHD